MIGIPRYLTRPRRFRLLLVAAIIAALLLGSCAASGGLLEAKLPDDGLPPATSAASAGRFVQKLTTAGEGAANTGRFTLTITDQEVTSFLNVSSILRQQAGSLPIEDLGQIQDIPELEGIDLGQWQELLGQQDRLPSLGANGLRLRLVIEKPGVYFLEDGRMIVRGNARFLVVSLPVRVVAAPRASRGELVLDFVEGQLGPVPMPEILFDYLGKGLARALLAGREYAEITEIRVTDGVLTVSGRWNG
jgi:hypothetical protein